MGSPLALPPGAVLALLSGPWTSPAVSSDDPFAAGPRWTHAPTVPEAWIPRTLVFAGEELLWCAASGPDARFLLLASASDRPDGTPLFSDGTGLDDLLGAPQVAAGDDGSELFALLQLAPAGARRTCVRRYDAALAARGAPFAPCWETRLAALTSGPALLSASADGTALAAAVFDPGARRVELELLDPLAGTARARRTLAGDGLKGLLHSADGSRLALGAGSTVHWLDAGGSVLWQRSLAASTSALALSADGRWLAHGELGRVALLHDTGGAFELAGTWSGSASELAVRAALSREGEALAIAWWDFADGASVRCELLDARSGVRLALHEQPASAGTPQNYPSALVLTPDGRRVALALWGAGDARPELLLLERGKAAPCLALDLGGSAETLALDPSGTRLAAGQRENHANDFSLRGSIRLLETGERDLVLRAAARPGGWLELAFHLPPDTSTALFAVGFLSPYPRRLPAGELWLAPRPRWFVLGGRATGRERADALQAIPADPGLIGLPWGVQAAGLGPSRAVLSATCVRLQVL